MRLQAYDTTELKKVKPKNYQQSYQHLALLPIVSLVDSY
nr:MAG TPA: hypothetical protein [Caudoviricetes sp.]